MTVDADDDHISLTEAIALSLQDYWKSIGLYLPHCRAEDIARAALLRLQPRRASLRDLRELDDLGLAEETREREMAFQDAVAELARRAASGGDQDWDERGVAALLAQKRNDIYHVDNGQTGTLPPPLFRMPIADMYAGIHGPGEGVRGHLHNHGIPARRERSLQAGRGAAPERPSPPRRARSDQGNRAVRPECFARHVLPIETQERLHARR